MEDPFELIARSVSRKAVQAEMDQLDREIHERAARKNKLTTLLSLLPLEDHPAAESEQAADDIDWGAPAKPTLAEAIPRVMEEGGRDIAWSGDEILSALVMKEWAPGGKTPKNSVAATLSRLYEEGLIVRVGRGRYRLPSETLDGISAGGARPATLLDDETEDS